MKRGEKMRKAQSKLLDDVAQVIGHAVLACDDASLRKILDLALDASKKDLREDLFLAMRSRGITVPERYEEESTTVFTEEDARVGKQRVSAAQARKRREARVAFEKAWQG